jgi:hypothetical protein
MAQHLYYGMGMVLNEGQPFQHFFPPPPGFPRCGDFDPSAAHVRESMARAELLASLVADGGLGDWS